MKWLLVVLGVLFSWLLVAAVSVTLTERKVGVTLVHHSLLDARSAIEVWHTLPDTPSAELERARQQLGLAVTRELILVRALNPSLSDIKGEALEALCMAVQPESSEIIDAARNAEVGPMIHSYLDSIREPTLARVSEIQKGLHGTGCYLSPEMQES